MNSIFPIGRKYYSGLDNDIDQLLGTFFGTRGLRGSDSTSFNSIPSANVAKNDEGYTIELAVPGMSREDFNISVENNTITVSSAVDNVQSDVEDMYTSKEFAFSSFTRSWTLPKGANSSAIGARYNAGILAVHIPVSSEDSRKVTISID